MSNRMLKASLFVLVILLAALLHKFNIVYEIEAGVPTGVDKNSPVVEALMAQLPVKDSSAVACTEAYDRRHYHYSAPKLRKMLATTRDSNRSIYTRYSFCLYGHARLCARWDRSMERSQKHRCRTYRRSKRSPCLWAVPCRPRNAQGFRE